MKTNGVPAMVMLLAGFVDCLFAIRTHMTLGSFTRQLFLVLLIFYIIGCVVKIILDRNIDKMEDVKTVEEELQEEKEQTNETQEEKATEDDLNQEKQAEEAPGTVISADKEGIRVACGKNVLVLQEVQLEGKKRMEADAGACEDKKRIATLAKKLDLDAIHDTVHEMCKDEARHGKVFEGLYNRYFKK